jgi:hypothetical protein
MEDENLVKYVHDIINKTISAQGFLKILSKSELDPQQTELLQNANGSLLESIEIIKALRKEIR